MAEREGLYYSVEVYDLFTDTLELFRRKVQEAKGVFEDFKQAVGGAAYFSSAAQSLRDLSKSMADLQKNLEGAPRAIRAANAATIELERGSADLAALQQKAADAAERMATTQVAALNRIAGPTERAVSITRLLENVTKDVERALQAKAQALAADAAASEKAGAAAQRAAQGFDAGAAAIDLFGKREEQAAVKSELLRLELEKARAAAGIQGPVQPGGNPAELAFLQNQDRSSFQREVAALQAEQIGRDRSAVQSRVTEGGLNRAELVAARAEIDAMDKSAASLERRFPGINAEVGLIAPELEKPNRLMQSLLLTAERLVVVYGTFRVFHEIVDLIESAVKRGIEFNSNIERTTLGIRAILGALTEVRDETGKSLDGVVKFNALQDESRRIVSQLRVDALKTADTFEHLAEVFQQALGPALSAGFNVDQVEKFTVAVSQAAAAIGLEQNQLAEEIRSLTTGPVVTGRSRIATALGLKTEDIENLRQAGTLAEFLLQRFQQFTIAGAASLDTFSVRLSNLKDALGQALGEGIFGAFTNLKGVLGEVQNLLVTITDTVKVSPAAKEFFEAIGSIVPAAVNAVRLAVSGIRFEAAIESAKALAAVVTGIFDVVAGVLKGAFVGLYVVLQPIVSAITTINDLLGGLGPVVVNLIAGLTGVYVALRSIILISQAFSLLMGGIGKLVTQIALDFVRITAFLDAFSTGVAGAVTGSVAIASAFSVVGTLLAVVTAGWAAFKLFAGETREQIDKQAEAQKKVNADSLEFNAILTANAKALEHAAETAGKLADELKKAKEASDVSSAGAGLTGIAKELAETAEKAKIETTKASESIRAQIKSAAADIVNLQRDLTSLGNLPIAEAPGTSVLVERSREILAARTKLLEIENQLQTKQLEAQVLAQARVRDEQKILEVRAQANGLETQKDSATKAVDSAKKGFNDVLAFVTLDTEKQKELVEFVNKRTDIEARIAAQRASQKDLAEAQLDLEKKIFEVQDAALRKYLDDNRARADAESNTARAAAEAARIEGRGVGESSDSQAFYSARAAAVRTEAKNKEEILKLDQQISKLDDEISGRKATGIGLGATEVALERELARLIQLRKDKEAENTEQLRRTNLEIERLRAVASIPQTFKIRADFEGSFQSIIEQFERGANPFTKEVEAMERETEKLKKSIAAQVPGANLAAPIREALTATTAANDAFARLQDRIADAAERGSREIAVQTLKAKELEEQLKVTAEKLGPYLGSETGKSAPALVTLAKQIANTQIDRVRVQQQLNDLDAKEGSLTDAERKRREDLLSREKQLTLEYASQYKQVLAISIETAQDEPRRKQIRDAALALSTVLAQIGVKQEDIVEGAKAEGEARKNAYQQASIAIEKASKDAVAEAAARHEQLAGQLQIALVQNRVVNLTGEARKNAEAELRALQAELGARQQSKVALDNYVGAYKALLAETAKETVSGQYDPKRIAALKAEADAYALILLDTEKIEQVRRKTAEDEEKIRLGQTKIGAGLRQGFEQVQAQIGGPGGIARQTAIDFSEGFSGIFKQSIIGALDPSQYRPAAEQFRQFFIGLIASIASKALEAQLAAGFLALLPKIANDDASASETQAAAITSVTAALALQKGAVEDLAAAYFKLAAAKGAGGGGGPNVAGLGSLLSTLFGPGASTPTPTPPLGSDAVDAGAVIFETGGTVYAAEGGSVPAPLRATFTEDASAHYFARGGTPFPPDRGTDTVPAIVGGRPLKLSPGEEITPEPIASRNRPFLKALRERRIPQPLLDALSSSYAGPVRSATPNRRYLESGGTADGGGGASRGASGSASLTIINVHSIEEAVSMASRPEMGKVVVNHMREYGSKTSFKR